MSSSVALPKEKKKDKKKEKRKEKEKNADATGYQKANEPVAEGSQDKSYQPPHGSVLLTNVIESEDFDYDTLKEDDDTELWVIRVPEGISAKHLQNQQISVPSTSRTHQIGTFSRKNTTYDIWSVHPDSSENDSPTLVGGGDETLGLSCLLPRKRKGNKLYSASKAITHHLVLSAQPPLPTPPTSSPEAFRRYCHPQTILKHRFHPTGSVLADDKSTDPDAVRMDVDGLTSTASAPKSAAAGTKQVKHAKEDKTGKAKKRKGETETETPKKVKKAKT